MSVEFGLAAGGEEHVEDRLECFRTECHRRPQQVVTQWGQCHDTAYVKWIWHVLELRNNLVQIFFIISDIYRCTQAKQTRVTLCPV